MSAVAQDHRDVVIEQLGDDLLEAREIAVRYQQLAIAAIEAMHAAASELARLRDAHHRVVTEFRRHREHRVAEAA